MGAGRYRERISFQRRGDVQDGYGNTKSDWALIDGLDDWPAQIQPLRGDEALEAEGLQARGRVNIIVRSTDETRSVKDSDRILDERTGETYNIRHIDNFDQRDRDLTMLCERGGGDG